MYKIVGKFLMLRIKNLPNFIVKSYGLLGILPAILYDFVGQILCQNLSSVQNSPPNIYIFPIPFLTIPQLKNPPVQRGWGCGGRGVTSSPIELLGWGLGKGETLPQGVFDLFLSFRRKVKNG